MGRWQDDCRRRTHCTKRRNEVCHEEIPGSLGTGAGGDETGREEAYPDLSSLKRELERTQRERKKAKLDRDQAKLERDQANLERAGGH